MATITWDDEESVGPSVVWDDAPTPPKKDSSILGDIVGGAVQGAANIGSTLLAPIDWTARKAGISNDFIGRDDRRAASRADLGNLGADTDSVSHSAWNGPPMTPFVNEPSRFTIMRIR